MTAIYSPHITRQENIRMALVVARREVRDSFRDWRIIIPIFLLTLIFPAIMNFTAGRLLNFVSEYGAEIIATQLVPFLLLIVGFFPMSFSLIIALETFVGEKERKSMEPLLATPITNIQLYSGKMVASLIPPLTAAYFGMFVYLAGLWFSIGWQPNLELLAQVMLLTLTQGLIMVAAAVVVSSQATSVRAANLLASFIIVPMALLLQFEAVVLFWGNSAGMWWLILALAMTAVILIRMGMFIFNREELLGRDIDQIRLGWMWQQLVQAFTGRDEYGSYLNPAVWLRQTAAILPKLGKPTAALLVALAGGILFGVYLGFQYRLPPEWQAQLTGQNMVENLSAIQVYVGALPFFIFFQNVRVILLQAILGIITLGVFCIIIFLLPWILISYAATQFYLAGQSPFTFLLATILPHAIIELPAFLLISAAALRWNMVVIARPANKSLSEVFLIRMAEYGRILVTFGIPLLIIAAFVESYVTPQVLLWVYGR
ncbi:MAG TPA: hypothetical protein ENJ93_07065 [Chloroflexi bacterium]|nr:hypothetical protein [Chloroflexota bacterium]